ESSFEAPNRKSLHRPLILGFLNYQGFGFGKLPSIGIRRSYIPGFRIERLVMERNKRNSNIPLKTFGIKSHRVLKRKLAIY
ncbi:hypothetical protein, partial [Bradyrhizobium sp. TM233]|uniref:hypothetical protein n=1 Tax=Bradyrhizobium sp. TM233 TaxID=2599801 RepID=UPI0030C69E3A